jgi:hypothetical protein
MKHQKNGLSLLLGLFIITTSSYTVSASTPPNEEACKAKLPGDLVYTYDACIQKDSGYCVKFGTRSITIKSDNDTFNGTLKNPGLGKCCIFGDDGNIVLDQRMTNNGNDECKEFMSSNPHATQFGIWWAVGHPEKDNTLKMDWWIGSK